MSRQANYVICWEECTDSVLLIRDVGPHDRHPTVTNDADGVVKRLYAHGWLQDGKRLEYIDSQGNRDEIKHENGRFVTFIPRYTNSIPFTQYLRPNGRARTIEIDRAPEIIKKARFLVSRFCSFEAEVLVTGECSFTCETTDGEVLAIEVVPNGPEVLAAVDRLVNAAYDKLRSQ